MTKRGIREGTTAQVFQLLSKTIACPFCGLRVNFGVTKEREQVSIHDLPPCQKFNDLTPLDFLVECNRKQQN